MRSDALALRDVPKRGRPAGRLDSLAYHIVRRGLAHLAGGELVLRDRGHEERFGVTGDLRAAVEVQDPRFYRAVLTGGALGAADAYIAGWWTSSDLTELIRLMIRNEAALLRLNGPWTAVHHAAQRVWHALRRNTRAGSRRNIAAHYDLSNDFYRLFLDETLTYSCGLFERPEDSLRTASVAKLDRICRKLALGPEDHVLEIGTGWGSFALHAAEKYGCRVTTTTISAQQARLARARIEEAGLGGRITVLERDYRDLEGVYDKLVSIEMIEAVGWQYYPAFFRQCARRLKPTGLACIQAITLADRYYDAARNSVDFIKRHVFPGSCIPSLAALTTAIAQASDLTVAHIEELTPHYATTLRAWRERFEAAGPQVRELGFTERFIRLWRYYLCYCEAGYHERTLGNLQILLAKPGVRSPRPLGWL